MIFIHQESPIMTSFPITPQNRVKRLPKRGSYDAATIYPILDEAMICHVGFVQDGQPYMIPTLHARDGDTLLLHGATTSRMLQHAAAGHPLCVTVTLIDGVVLARSVFHHSINYRSAVVFGVGTPIEDADAKMAALARFTDKLLPGRWADARPPNEVELKATAVVAVDMLSASAKVRTGDPGDDEEDIALPIWAGVIPLALHAGAPIPAPNLAADVPLPDYLAAYVKQRQP
jgi:hypothetical protein